MRAIVTVIGKDRMGIIAGVSQVLAEHQVNILDISQTILQDYFAMIMLVDLTELKCSFTNLCEILDQKGQSLGVSVRIQREDIFKAMHQV